MSKRREKARRAAVCVRRGRRPRTVSSQIRACCRFADSKRWRVVAMVLDGPATTCNHLSDPLAGRLHAGEFDAVVTPTETGAVQVFRRRGSRQ